ncbi:MAG: histidine triad nucleotide-binding protein [Syntrophothermus sp.]
MGETIFSKIIRKEIPAKIVYESDSVLAFRDINPQAPVHILIIPKVDVADVREISGKDHAELLGDLMDAANEVARLENLDKNGFRLVINSGPDSGQEVPHLHIHLLGGRKMNWPPG